MDHNGNKRYAAAASVCDLRFANCSVCVHGTTHQNTEGEICFCRNPHLRAPQVEQEV
jgi:hypothetical protein